MGKYTKEVKAKCVEAAKNGVSLKVIQTTLGPNPKATLRYLVAEGIDYTKLKKELIEAGTYQGVCKKNKSARDKEKKDLKEAERLKNKFDKKDTKKKKTAAKAFVTEVRRE